MDVNVADDKIYPRPITHLAQLVIEAQDKGVIDGWRKYIIDQAKRSGITNTQMAEEIKRQKALKDGKTG